MPATLADWTPLHEVDTDDLPAWDGPLYELRNEAGKTVMAEYGWDEETVDGYVCAWHEPGTLDPIASELSAVEVRLAPE